MFVVTPDRKLLRDRLHLAKSFGDARALGTAKNTPVTEPVLAESSGGRPSGAELATRPAPEEQASKPLPGELVGKPQPHQQVQKSVGDEPIDWDRKKHSREGITTCFVFWSTSPISLWSQWHEQIQKRSAQKSPSESWWEKVTTSPAIAETVAELTGEARPSWSEDSCTTHARFEVAESAEFSNHCAVSHMNAGLPLNSLVASGQQQTGPRWNSCPSQPLHFVQHRRSGRQVGGGRRTHSIVSMARLIRKIQP